ncbi:bifunctional acetate--CoA ligase family protein/GNAT family N-acetyltransferase [Phenylobacterium sp.]|uniref:bifunctional acetate--CoA ligase family protein/GNAT family N-acetyltransferase n=1 Tax=Phenylobacterium sp. TaxID=1871053 RepID=UPI00273724B0|nr:bifunctional acetate--CoA ligase family protein/GNAT family N-acetyltransferase [Phenylobacterium sp.]MDP3852433.1 bifunctional acetate--CoA ligase family protein/GNAT family N-acetyltransferase [Phenylobacterium sp.]
MTTRNLDALFHPGVIALIGASNSPASVGQVLSRNLLESGFAGPVLPVALNATAIRSAVAYRSVADLPLTPDLAVIATPAPTVPGLIAELGARGCRAAVVISAGVDAGLRQAMLDAARPHLMRIVGPNCLGFISPRVGINASFAHLTPAAGGLALVSQSGAVAAAALDWAHGRGIGFSHVLSIGDAADVDVGDLLDYLALDPETKAILLYVESLADARKFMTAGRIAARAKPVVVVKAGRSASGAKAAFSHTGALAGSDMVYDAAFRRAGMLRVDDLRELFDAVAALGAGLKVTGDRLAILTNGGGAGVMAADALEARGGRLAELSAATLERLNAAAPANWSHANPVDILGDARAPAYGRALEALLAEPAADAILVMNCPTAVSDSTEAADVVIETLRADRSHRPVLSAWLGQTAVAEGRRRLSAAGVPAHETPDEAVRTFMQLVEHRKNQQALLRTPAAPAGPACDHATACAVIDQAAAEGRTALTDPEARAILQAYGVPVLQSLQADDPAAAAAAAATFAGPVALKILSPDISHKSDVGGVTLGLQGAAATEAEARGMLARVATARPDARIQGFVVEPMVRRPQALELLAGVAQDATFGPVIVFGAGGVAVEVVADRIIGLPPLDEVLAKDMIARTRISRLLAGYRDRPPANIGAIADVLARLSRLVVELPEIAELDINPLLADAEGVLALDARMALRPIGAQPVRTAILPYPDYLRRELTVGVEALIVRPVRPQDGPGLAQMVEKSAPEDVRLRFRSGLRTLPQGWPERLSQIDYDREMALVAEAPDGSILGVARLVGDPEGDTAEFALMVRSDHHDRGLGRLLLAALLEHAQSRGLREVWGDVARDNARMLTMAAAFGFERHAAEGDFSRVRLVKTLGAGAPAPAPRSLPLAARP